MISYPSLPSMTPTIWMFTGLGGHRLVTRVCVGRAGSQGVMPFKSVGDEDGQVEEVALNSETAQFRRGQRAFGRRSKDGQGQDRASSVSLSANSLHSLIARLSRRAGHSVS